MATSEGSWLRTEALESGRVADKPWMAPCHISLAVLGALLVLTTVAHVGWGIAMMQEPSEVMYGEAIIYDQAARLLRGEPLYQPTDRPPYTVAAYTPLYYWVAAGLQAVLGPGFRFGRGLAIVAAHLVAILVAYLVASRVGDRRAGAFAGLLFLVLGLPGVPPWSVLYKQDIVGVALSMAAIAVLTGGTTPRRVIVAAVLAGLAVLTKQTFVAAGFAGFFWLWQRDRSLALMFMGVALSVDLAVCATYEFASGAFLENTVSANVNPFRLDALVPGFMTLATFQAGPLAVAGLYTADRTQADSTDADKLFISYWLASMLPLVGLAKVGSNVNYWIELAAITAVLATLGTWARLQLARASMARAIVPVLLLGLTVITVTPSIGHSALVGLALLKRNPAPDEEFSRLLDRVRAEPHEVLADPLDVVVLAGRPLFFEPYVFNILGSQGRWDDAPLVSRICAGDVGLLVLDRSIESDGPAYHGYAHWPRAVLAALRETAEFEGRQAGRFMYRLHERVDGETCSRALRHASKMADH